MPKIRLDKKNLIQKLERISYVRPEKNDLARFDQINLAGSLMLLAEIGHEELFNLSREVAQHLLGSVPEPDDSDLANG